MFNIGPFSQDKHTILMTEPSEQPHTVSFVSHPCVIGSPLVLISSDNCLNSMHSPNNRNKISS